MATKYTSQDIHSYTMAEMADVMAERMFGLKPVQPEVSDDTAAERARCVRAVIEIGRAIISQARKDDAPVTYTAGVERCYQDIAEAIVRGGE